jgi:AAA domain
MPPRERGRPPTERPTPQDNSPDASVPAGPEPFGARFESTDVTEYDDGLRWRRRSFADVTPRAVRWLVPGVVPLRTSTLTAGQGGLGKSTWLMAVAAQVTTGKLNGGEPASVIVVSYEDTIEEILRPRAEAANADLGRLFDIAVPADLGGAVLLPRDISRLGEQIEETAAKLVIVDPILAAIDLSLDAHKDQHMRVVLAQFADLAEKHHCAIVLVLHLNKAPAVDPYLRISSSSGFYNAARSVVVVVPDPDEPEEHRLVAQVKSNWSRRSRSPVQRHVLNEILLDTRDPDTGEQIVTSRMEFVEVAAGIDRDTILASGRHDQGEQAGKATGWLEGMLTDGDWHDSAALKKLADGQDITERTLQRAIRELGGEVERRGFPSSTYWRLPPSHANPYPHHVGATGEGGSNPHEHDEPEHTEIQSRQGAMDVRDAARLDGHESRFCEECDNPERCAAQVYCQMVARLPSTAEENEVERLAVEAREAIHEHREQDPAATPSSDEKALLREVADLVADGTLIPLFNEEGTARG